MPKGDERPGGSPTPPARWSSNPAPPSPEAAPSAAAATPVPHGQRAQRGRRRAAGTQALASEGADGAAVW